jgi:hypothetical protein
MKHMSDACCPWGVLRVLIRYTMYAMSIGLV